MENSLFDWSLLLGRWIHITAAVTWIGTSIFFMWLDRTFVKLDDPTSEGHVGELWMVHGGGFYRVEKLLMGPTKVPKILHWFKWEAYTTWLSGMFLLLAIFYTGGGNYLIDTEVAQLSYWQATGIGLGGLFISWVLYDLIWESPLGKSKMAHVATFILFILVTYLYHKTLSGRGAYIHTGALMGTWMVGNVLLRIIPRQVKMVEASKAGEEVPGHWGTNAKSRSTHNTYFTLPVIFIMFSNHFPSTYGHDCAFTILLFLCLSGALVRHYFVIRHNQGSLKNILAFIGVAAFIGAFAITSYQPSDDNNTIETSQEQERIETSSTALPVEQVDTEAGPAPEPATLSGVVKGVISYNGKVETKKLTLPGACSKHHGKTVYSQSLLVKNGKLKNVLVFLSGNTDKIDFDLDTSKEVVIDQVGCLYTPKTVGVLVGQKVRFVNSDPIFHNVRTLTKKNKKFNRAMPKQNSFFVKSFNKPELPLLAKCSVHPWMRANIGVFDHPFFTVSDENGEYKLENLPLGQYTLNFWHESLGHTKEDIEISNSTLKNYEFKK